MSKVTLIWFSDAHKPFKTFTLHKTLVSCVLAAGILFLLLAMVFFWMARTSGQKLEAYRTENRQLQQSMHSQSQKIEDLQQKISRKEASIQDLQTRVKTSHQELQEIREMEIKIRSYLGMEPEKELKMSTNQTHQGGFRSMGSGQSWTEAASAAGSAPGLVSYSLSLKESIDELLQSLRKRQKQMRHKPTILPIKGEDIWLSCSYGWRENPMTSRREFHSAIDVAGKWKTCIIAPAAGTVSEVGKNRIWGNFVRLDHGNGFVTAYGHLHSAAVEEGQKVRRKQVIGYMGNTGHSTGTHLHYKVLKDGEHVNPTRYILDRDIRTLALR